MNIIDIILVLLVIPMVIRGVTTGFISQAFGLAAIVLGTIIAWRLALPISPKIAESFDLSIKISNVITFAVVFLIVSLVFILVGKALRKLIKLILLGWLDALLGAVLAFATTVLVCGLLLIMFESLNDTLLIIDKKYMEESLFFRPLTDFVKTFFPYVHDLLHNIRI